MIYYNVLHCSQKAALALVPKCYGTLGVKIHHIVIVSVGYIVVITMYFISFHFLINITKGPYQGISFYVALGAITKQVNPKLHEPPTY